MELTYKVDPGDDVTVDAEDFYDFFYDEADYDELEYVDELTITHALMNRREIE